MICFVTALRSKKSTNQWSKALEDFNNTLQSIFNQTHSYENVQERFAGRITRPVTLF